MAVACCRANFRAREQLLAGVAPGFDWESFLRLVRHHRVEAFAWKALADSQVEVPADVEAELSGFAGRIVARQLEAAASCRDLLERFADANIPLLFLKGLTLAALAYQNPALKSSIDIDLLIDPADLGAAARILREAGFALTTPSDSPGDNTLLAWHRGWKESVWTRGALQVDLHTRTADHPRLIPSIDVHSPRQMVDIGNGIVLPTLPRDELFAYLAVHGASSAWFRLKWIADFAAFLTDPGAAELNRLYRRSQRLGAGRAAGQALLLADDLFGSLQTSPKLRAQLRADRAIVALERAALELLTGESIEPTERRFGTFAIHRTQLSLLPGVGFALSELARQVKQKFIRPG